MTDLEDLGFETLTFYNGSVQLIFEHALHAYSVVENGEKILVPGSTTVLDVVNKPALVQWASNETVQWILQHFPVQDEQARATLLEHYQRVKDKVPWEEIEQGSLPARVVSCPTTDLARLLNDARFNYKKISKEATDIGHLAHSALESIIKLMLQGQSHEAYPLPENPNASNCVKAALDWMAKHNFRPVASEQRIYSREYAYAGTFDWTGYVTGCGDPACCPFEGEVFALGDFKSSKALWEEYRIQVSSYKQALEEEFPETHVDVGIVLRLGKFDGEFEPLVIPRHELDIDFEAFLGALSIFNWQKQRHLDAKAVKDAIKLQKKLEKAALAAAKPKKTRAIRKVKTKCFEPIPIEIEAA
jgi:hypothetical protein